MNETPTDTIVDAEPSANAPLFLSIETAQLAFDLISSQAALIDQHAAALDELAAQCAAFETELQELRVRVQDAERSSYSGAV